MTTHCVLCGSPVADPQAYQENVKRYVRLTRYQKIIDVLIDSGRYDHVYFDHDTELPSPYRGIAHHKRNALQEQSGKGKVLQVKWPDVVGVKQGTCEVVIEEEREPGVGKVEEDIRRITQCRYLWTDGRLFSVVEPYLFILVSDNLFGTAESVRENVGTFRRVVICAKDNFEVAYKRYFFAEVV